MGMGNFYRILPDGKAQCLACYGEVLNGECLCCHNKYDEDKLVTGDMSEKYLAYLIAKGFSRIGKSKLRRKVDDAIEKVCDTIIDTADKYEDLKRHEEYKKRRESESESENNNA